MTRDPIKTRYQANTRLMWAMALILFINPFFLGGNRPAVWALFGALVFAVAAAYHLRLAAAGIGPRRTLAHFPFASVIFATMAAYMFFQTLPVAGELPDWSTRLPFDVPPVSTLSLTPDDTLLELMRWITYGVFFYLGMQVCANRTRAFQFLKLVYWVVFAHAVYGATLLFEFGDVILFAQKWAYQGSATGGFVNRNSFATFLAMGCVVGICIIHTSLLPRPDAGSKRWQQGSRASLVLMSCSLVLMAATLLATNSRMGSFAALSGIAFVFLLAFSRTGRSLSAIRLTGIAATAIAAIVALVFLYGFSLVERLGTAEEDSDVRIDLYRQVWEMIKTRPFTGFGGSSFEYAYPLFHHSPVTSDLVWEKTHNTYLALWVEYGLLFGSLPLIIVAAIVWRIMMHYRETSPSDSGALAALGVIAVAAIHSLADFSLEIQGVVFLFIAIVANGFVAPVFAERLEKSSATRVGWRLSPQGN